MSPHSGMFNSIMPEKVICQMSRRLLPKAVLLLLSCQTNLVRISIRVITRRKLTLSKINSSHLGCPFIENMNINYIENI